MKDFIINLFSNFQDKNDYVLNEKGYNIHVSMFDKDIHLSVDDFSYLKERASLWRKDNIDYGSELLLCANNWKVIGTVSYGEIND